MSNQLEQCLNINIDGILCISLKEDSKRREEAMEEFKKIGISNKVQYHVVEQHPEGGIKGCLTSHLECIQIAKNNNWNNVLICEDDILFDMNILNNVKINVPKDFDMFYLGYHINKGYKYADNIVKLLSGFTTHGYIMNKKIYDYVLENINKDWKSIPEYHILNDFEKPYFKLDHRAIDVFYSKWVHHRLNNSYGIYPIMAYQRPTWSHIENQEVNYMNLFITKAGYHYNNHFGTYRGHYKLEDYGSFKNLLKHLKKLNHSKWDYILVSDLTDVYHERDEKNNIDIIKNTISNDQSWDILSLTETWTSTKINDIVNHDSKMKLLTLPNLSRYLTLNETEEFYKDLEKNPNLDNDNSLKRKLSKSHIYYLRMTCLDKFEDDYNVEYQFPPIDNYEFIKSQSKVKTEKPIVCVYLPDNMNYKSIRKYLGNIDEINLYVCENNKTESTEYISINREEYSGLPIHSLILVDDITYFIDNIINTSQIILLMTQNSFTKKWNELPIPIEGRSLLHNMLDKITKIVCTNETIFNNFMTKYEIQPKAQLTCILGELKTKKDNRIIYSIDNNIDEVVETFNKLHKDVPNLMLYIYNGNKKLMKKYKKYKNCIIVFNELDLDSHAEFIISNDTNVINQALNKGIICIGDNKSSQLKLEYNTIKKLLLNPVHKRNIRSKIYERYNNITYIDSLII